MFQHTADSLGAAVNHWAFYPDGVIQTPGNGRSYPIFSPAKAVKSNPGYVNKPVESGFDLSNPSNKASSEISP